MNTNDSVIFLDYPEAVSVDDPDFSSKRGNHFVVIPVAEVNMPAMNALQYAKLIGGRNVAVHILFSSSDRNDLEYQWKFHDIDIPLVILESPEGSLLRPLKAYIDGIHSCHKESVVTIVLPVLIGLKWWQRVLHNQTARLIERAFAREAGVVTLCVPFPLSNASFKGSCLL